MGITQITTVKGRTTDVVKNLSKWLSSGIDQLVIVDYACPAGTYKELLKIREAKDPRVTILHVPPQIAGPFYNHSRARNIGVQCAKFDILLFLDVDCIPNQSLITNARRLMEELHQDLVTPLKVGANGRVDEFGYCELPMTWPSDGQLVIRNAAFYDANGFSEGYHGWGGETYDLIFRAQAKGARIAFVPENGWFRHIAHQDPLRDQYLSVKIGEGLEAKQAAYKEAEGFYRLQRRRSLRAQPGSGIGITDDNPFIKAVTMYRGGNAAVFNPGE